MKNPFRPLTSPKRAFDSCPKCGGEKASWVGWSKRVTRRYPPEHLTEGKRDVKLCPCGYSWRYGRNGPITDRRYLTAGEATAYQMGKI